MIEDRLLIWRFNRGDAGALCRIYEKYRDDLLKVAVALLNDRSGVDVLHDVFVDFAQNTRRFELKGSLKGYLAICVANRARDRNRTLRRRGAANLDEIRPGRADADGPERRAVSDELAAKLDAAMARLPNEQREAVVLHLQSKMRFREIAELRGISVNRPSAAIGTAWTNCVRVWMVKTMSDSKETQRLVAAYLENLPTPNEEEVDGKVLPDALETMHRMKNQRAVPSGRAMWRTIMTSKISKLATVAVIIVVALSLTVFDGLTQPTWAWEDAIEALKDFGAVHITGASPGGTAEIWMRANATKTQSTDVVVKGSHGTITWTKDGSTYHYEPSQNTVYYERALTIGMTDWLGPELLEMLSTAENAEVVRGKDPATGRDRVMLLCSLIEVHGAQSWIIEFDAASKLPVAMKQWQNLDRSGPPDFDAFKITYYETLPDSVFAVQIPGQPAYVQKPLTIPDENIDMLSDARHGISAEGMTQQEAAERAVRTLFQAVIDDDLATLKRVCPLCETWGDEFLRSVIMKTGQDGRIVEILEIGRISETGHSKLGPIVALPISVRRQDGVKVQQKMIVQFRQLGGVPSCVVHGPYGLPREMQ